MTLKTLGYLSFALFCFAGNSVLCRIALGEQLIDAASFTMIRLFSGIVVLVLLLFFSPKQNQLKSSKGSWLAALMLFVYALAFSYAYISLGTGIGALILFASVQFCMIFIGWFSGNKLLFREWVGIILAFSGFVYLVFPNLSTPSFWGFVLMSLAGVAWGVYSLLGRNSQNPMVDTAYNFLRTLPMLVVLIWFSLGENQFESIAKTGAIFAILSGAIASALGYTVWYLALKGLSVTQAAVVQLSVPIIAAVGGVLFVNETVDLRLIFSSLLVLGGILFVLIARKYKNS